MNHVFITFFLLEMGMARTSLGSMSVEALLKLRNDIWAAAGLADTSLS
jgi:hypothetical protein